VFDPHDVTMETCDGTQAEQIANALKAGAAREQGQRGEKMTQNGA